MKRIRITDLAATGHPKECSRLILQAKKAKYTKQEGHKVSIHLIAEENIVHIDVDEGDKLLNLEIPKDSAVRQAYEILGLNPTA